MNNAKLEVQFDQKQGHFQILFQNTVIFSKLTAILYYDEEWLSESTGELQYLSGNIVSHENFEQKAYFGQCIDYQKHFNVKTDEELFQIVLHAYYFPSLQTVYFNADLSGNQAKSDILVGCIDLGVPQECDSYRFFHGFNWRAPTENLESVEYEVGMGFFDKTQSPWQEPCYLDHLPNNAQLSISYLMGQIKKSSLLANNSQITENDENYENAPMIPCFAVVPTNRYGQRSIIRSCNFLDQPHGIKLVGGDFLLKSQYNHIAGGMVAFGVDPISLTQKIMCSYMNLIDRTHVLREYKSYPEIFEYLGFCTWNTFYRAVDMEGIEDLAAGNFTKESGSDRFRYLIVDDGWQSISGCDIVPGAPTIPSVISQGLQHFQANYKFPNGIQEVANLLKDKYNFKWVGLWHAVLGYWKGVEPTSDLGQKYSILLNNQQGYPDPKNLHGFEFWVDYYKHLRASNIDFLKIDNQSSIGSVFDGRMPIDNAIENHYLMQQGAAYAQNLEILNCMCMASDCKINWTMSNVSRVSDDFYPGNIPACKHQIKQCTYNPLYYASYCWPDHDMFQTNSEIWKPLILLHMVSGGPVYIADEVEETNSEVINKISYPDGKLPRLDHPAYPTFDVIFGDSDVDTPCKMWNFHDIEGWHRIYYMYASNITKDQKLLEVQLGLNQFNDPIAQKFSQSHSFIPQIEGYLVKDMNSERYEIISSKDDLIDVKIENLAAKYFQFTPIYSGIALLGIKEIYNGTTAIDNVEIISSSDIIITMKYAGTLQIYLADNTKIEIDPEHNHANTQTNMVLDSKIVELPVKKGIIYLKMFHSHET